MFLAISLQQDRRYQTAGFSDEPELCADGGVIHEQNPRALNQGLVVGLAIFSAYIAPIAGLVTTCSYWRDNTAPRGFHGVNTPW